jgi:hypothetical protein
VKPTSDQAPLNSPLLPIEEVFREASDFVSSLIERKVSRIENVNLGAGHIFAVSFRACYGKRGVVTSPNDKQWRLTVPQPFLPSGIQSNVSLVIEEKIQLNISLPGLVQEIVFIHPIFRIDILRVRRSAGHGLGLSLARELARAHGGDVTLVSSREGWTIFRVTLRLVVPRVSPAAQPTADRLPAIGRS